MKFPRDTTNTLPRRVTASSLGFARTFPLLTLLVSLSLSALPICLQAQAARKFSWTYSYDPPGQRGREWTQLGPSKWLEVCQSGQRNTFTVTNRSATVAGNHGQIVERDDHALSVFIPDANAQGKDPDWLRVWRRGIQNGRLLQSSPRPRSIHTRHPLAGSS
jgi:hypothetical protein